MSIKFLFVQLNEINFDLVNSYLSFSKENKFKYLKEIKNSFASFETYSEDKYENLEPWIQWTSVSLGKTFSEHRIFRLGDIVNFSKEKQLFEKIEEKGFKVGAISSMNAANRLKKPSYFISDPWTDTYSDNSNFSKRISLMLRQTVNENASSRLSLNSILTIVEIILRTLHYKKTFFLIKLIFSSLIKPWKKSLVLDYLLHLLHIYLYKKKSPNFSSIFFNAGAHIQHHYFFNAKYLDKLQQNPSWYIHPNADPFEDMLEVYDKIISDYLDLSKKNKILCVATGLRQIPYNTKKFYYRLKNHSLFLKNIGVKFIKVLPRMTRDFEIVFSSNKDRDTAKAILENLKSKRDDINIFDEIELRENSLFVTLTYPNEIKKNDFIIIDNKEKINFFDQVVFVAIKNGMHDSTGYVFFSPNTNLDLPKYKFHVSKLHNLILSIFKIF